MKKTLAGIVIALSALTLSGCPPNRVETQNPVTEIGAPIARAPMHRESGMGLTAADLNGDGRQYIILGTYRGGNAHIYTLYNNGDGTYTSNYNNIAQVESGQ